MLELKVSTRGLLLFLGAILALLAVARVWPVLLLILVSFIFMAALLPYVDWLVRHRFPRVGAVVAVFGIILLVVAGLMYLVIPALVDQVTVAIDNFPEDARKLDAVLADFGLETDLESRAKEFDWGALISGNQAFDLGQQVLIGAIGVISVFVLTAYLLVDAHRLEAFLYSFVPAGKEPEIERVLLALGRVVGGYVRGQLITSVLAGLFTFAVCLALGVPNPLVFGVLSLIGDLIPIAGVFLAMAPTGYAAYQISLTHAVIVIVALSAYQQIEDRILVPRIYGQTLNLPPLIVVVAVLVGGQLLGLAGVLLALPGAAAIRVALDFYRERHTGGLTPPIPSTEIAAPDAA